MRLADGFPQRAEAVLVEASWTSWDHCRGASECELVVIVV